MTSSLHPLVDQLVEICAPRGVHDSILAPGSRSAPSHRSAHPPGGDALPPGCAASPRRRLCGPGAGAAAAHTCRTGLHLGHRRRQLCAGRGGGILPGCAAARTHGQPAARMDEQQDNQAIHQNDLYAPHVRAGFTLPLDDGEPDTRWFVARIVANAIDTAQGWEPGPVHINVPLREPLYTPLQSNPSIKAAAPGCTAACAREPAAARRRRLAGTARPMARGCPQADRRRHASCRLLPPFCAGGPGRRSKRGDLCRCHGQPTYAARCAVTCRRDPQHTHDSGDAGPPATGAGHQLWRAGDVQKCQGLARGSGLKALWHVRPNLIAPDTYQALSHVVPMVPTDFFGQLAGRLSTPEQGKPPVSDATYQGAWAALDSQAAGGPGTPAGGWAV